MIREIVLPNLGFGMEEGRVIAWLKAPGDPVRRGEPIAEVESDKANVELESTTDGVLVEIVVPAGEMAQVGSALARVETDASAAAEASPSVPAQTTPKAEALESPAGNGARLSPVAQRMAREHGLDPAALSGSGPGGRVTRSDVQAHLGRSQHPAGKVLAAPGIRRLAREQGIDLATITPTGKEGQVTRADLEAALAAAAKSAAQPSAAPQPGATTPQPAVAPPNVVAGRREVPLSPMRRTIARRLTESVLTAPHFYTTAELDLTDALAALPEQVGLNALLSYVVVQALQDVPQVNGTFENDTLYSYDHVNLATAVALDTGLITPVLHRADDFSPSGLSDRLRDLISRARAQRLKPDEMQGGTFTISNLGMVKQIERFTAIINPPQLAILAVGAARQRPHIIGGGLHIRATTFVTLAADHRVIDGMIAARFLEALDDRLQAFASQKDR